MTASKPLTLEIKNGNGGVLNTVPVTALPKPSNINKVDMRAAQKAAALDRLEARAKLCAVYGGILGVEVARIDALETLQSATRRDMSVPQQAHAMAKALKNAGLMAQTAGSVPLGQVPWPALAFMTSGQVVMVLGRTGAELVVYDTSCPDNRAMVPEGEFAPYFSGQIVVAEASLERVETNHKLAPTERHWFWGQFPQYRKQMLEVTLGSLVANLLAVSVALFSLQVYDRVIPHQSEATLWVLAIGAVLALLMEAFIKIARARLMDGAGRQIELSVLEILMAKVLGTRSDARGMPPSLRFSQMREFSSVREFFTASTIGTLADIPFIFVFLLLVSSIAGPVVWVLIAGGLLMVVPGFFLQKRMMRLTQETQGASVKSSRVLHEAIFELDTIKTQRAEDRVMRVWSELSALSAIKSSEQRRLASVLTFWSQGIQQATYVAAVIAGTYLVFAGNFTVGSIIAVGILTSRTLAPLTSLAGIMARWGNVKTALDGLESIAEAPQDHDETRSYLRRDALKGEFELREVSFAYEEDGAAILDLPALKLLAGQKIAVLGPNGSGKSTLLKLLSGLYAPSKGRVLIDGTEMGQIEPRDLRRLIGYLGQDVRLFAGSLRENLNLTMLDQDDLRLMQALDFAGLGKFVRNHPKGLDLEIQDAGLGLSVGQRQSIGWARLWLQDPKICLLDEPTAALDQSLEKAMVERLATWIKGRTAVIATHRVPILALMDRTLVLNEGRMQVDGPREQVMQHLSGSKVVPLKGAVA